MSHTHGPGQPAHSHSHGPPQGQPAAAPQAQQYQPPPQPDPKMEQLIAASFQQVDLKLSDPNNSKLLCKPHSQEKCEECGVDFASTNALARLFVSNPQLICPPPPQVVQQQRSQAVNKTKDQGNQLFKAKKMKEALSMYTMAANIAVERLPWEPSMLMKEELATILSNRSAAYCAVGDYISALVDADLVIQLKRPWSKGHFRKAKALEELGDFEEAREAVRLGLFFEPTNNELKAYLDEIESRITKKSG